MASAAALPTPLLLEHVSGNRHVLLLKKINLREKLFTTVGRKFILATCYWVCVDMCHEGGSFM